MLPVSLEEEALVSRFQARLLIEVNSEGPGNLRVWPLFLACSTSQGALGATWPRQNRSQCRTNLFIRGWQFMDGIIILSTTRCLCDIMCSTLFSRATCAKKQARVTPNRSVLYDPPFRNEKETCYIQKSHSLGASSPNLPGGAHHYGP